MNGKFYRLLDQGMRCWVLYYLLLNYYLIITLYGLTSLSFYASVHFLICTNVYDFQGFF